MSFSMRLHTTKKHETASANDLRQKPIAVFFGLQITMNSTECVRQDTDESISDLFHTTFPS